MKIQNRFLIGFLLICITSLSSLASSFAVNITGDNSFGIELPNKSYDQIQVTLKDVNGYTLYDETFMQSNLSQKTFNLKKLPIGDYILKVAYDVQTKIQAIKKNQKSLEIDANDLQTIFQPTLRLYSDYVDLNMLCLVDLDISLTIKDGDGNTIYNELIQTDEILQKRFNLSMLNEGSYTFKLTIKDPIFFDTYEESIEWMPAVTASL